MNNPDYVTQDGTCKVSDLWMSDCNTFWENTCQKVGVVSSPLACVKTIISKPSFYEALGTAYANLAFLSSIVLPGVAILMVKLSEKAAAGAGLSQSDAKGSEVQDNNEL